MEAGVGGTSKKATFVLPRLGYFKFEDVVPGHYAACVLAGPGWLTKKAEVDETKRMKFFSLDLVPGEKTN